MTNLLMPKMQVHTGNSRNHTQSPNNLYLDTSTDLRQKKIGTVDVQCLCRVFSGNPICRYSIASTLSLGLSNRRDSLEYGLSGSGGSQSTSRLGIDSKSMSNRYLEKYAGV